VAWIPFNGLRQHHQERPENLGIADIISKSIAYENALGLLTLSEVAVGNMNQHFRMLSKRNNMKFHSTKMAGTSTLDPKKTHVREDGVIILLGRPLSVDMSKPSMHGESEFLSSTNHKFK
jgi:hypothetical protein